MAKQYKPSDSKSIKLFFREFLELTQDMKNEEVGQLIKDLCVHATVITEDQEAGLYAWSDDPEPIFMNPEAKAVYRMLSQQIDRNFDEYRATCVRNHKAAMTRVAKSKGIPVEDLYQD